MYYVIIIYNIVKYEKVLPKASYIETGNGGIRMLNQDKVRIMTRLAIYEQGRGKEELKINKCYKNDYVRLQVIKSFVASTLGSLLIIVMSLLYQSEYLILNATKLNFVEIGKATLFIYIMVCILYFVITIASASLKYSKAKKSLRKYNYLLRKLERTYAADKAGKE